MNSAKNYSVQVKVRPYVEIVEITGGRGLQTAAIIYGDTKKEAEERAQLLAQYMKVEATPAYIRKRLKLLSWYKWFYGKTRESGDRLTAYHLGLWLIGAWVDPQQMGQWLAKTFLKENPAQPGAVVATILDEKEVS